MPRIRPVLSPRSDPAAPRANAPLAVVALPLVLVIAAALVSRFALPPVAAGVEDEPAASSSRVPAVRQACARAEALCRRVAPAAFAAGARATPQTATMPWQPMGRKYVCLRCSGGGGGATSAATVVVPLAFVTLDTETGEAIRFARADRPRDPSSSVSSSREATARALRCLGAFTGRPDEARAWRVEEARLMRRIGEWHIALRGVSARAGQPPVRAALKVAADTGDLLALRVTP